MRHKEKPKLTTVDLEFDIRVAKTPAGMAFWAGTGPKGKTCRECAHYTFQGYGSDSILKKGPCQKYVSYRGIDTHKIPFRTAACKYFELNEKPPAIEKQGN